MAGQLEKISSRLTVGLLAVGVGLLLVFVPVAASAGDTDDYPVTTSSSTTSSSTTSTTDPGSTTTTTDPTDVERSTLERSETGSSSLPRTGSDIAPWIISGVFLVAVGGGIIFLTRRRSSTI
jgi:LPXTG-motif cell wall-anchored protein